MGTTVNTFENNGHYDNAPLMQPNGTFRDNLNMRIISNGGDNYSLVDINGTIVSFGCNPGFVPIGFKSFPELLVVHSVNYDINRGEIGIVEIPKITKVGTYTPIYCNSDLEYDIDHLIECRGISKGNGVYVIYFWDNKNSPRVMNVSDPKLNTNIPTGSLRINGRYMVVKGQIDHAGTNYGPNETDNIFIATGVNYTDLAGGSIVIEYVPVQNFEISQKASFVVPRLTGRIAGQLCGTYYYVYRLTDSEGNGTGWSLPSAPVYINISPLRSFGDGSYLDAQMDGAENISGGGIWGVEMTIDYIDTSFEKIELAYFKAIDETSFEDPVIFDIIDVTTSTLTFQHTTDGGAVIDPEDLIRANFPIIKCKTGDINKNTLFIGNFELFADPDYEVSSSVTTATVVQQIPCDDTEALTGINPSIPGTGSFAVPLYGVGHTPAAGITASNQFDGAGYEGLWYEVTTGSISLSNSATAKAPTVIVGPTYFQWPVGYNQWTVSAGSPAVYPVLRIKLYAGAFRYIRISNDYMSPSGMMVNHYIRNARRTETYRVGFCLVDKFGNPLYVRHLKDVTIPDHIANPMVYSVNNNDTGLGTDQIRYVLNNLGIRFDNIDFNNVVDGLKELYDDPAITLADLPNYFDGFSIVLCRLDKQIYGEGILSPVTAEGSSYWPAAHARANFDEKYAAVGNRKLNAWMLRAADLIFGINEKPIEPEENDELVVLEYLDAVHPVDALRGSKVYDDTDLFQTVFNYMKLYDSQTPVGSQKNRTNKIDPEHTHLFKSASDTFFWGPDQVNLTYRGWLTNNFSGVATPYTVVGTGKNTRNHAAFIWTKEDGVGSDFAYPQAFVDPSLNQMPPVYAAYKKKKNVLYGGNSQNAKANNEYFFCGHYQRFDANFMAYITGNAGIASEIEIYGFDSFLQLWDVVYAYPDARFLPFGGTSFGLGVGLVMPVQTDRLIRYREGRNFAHEKIYSYNSAGALNTDGICFQYETTGQPYQPEQIVLNRAYQSTSAWNIPLVARPYNYVPRRFYEKAFAFSLRAIDGESRDNLRRFAVGNIVELDQNGALINLKTKNGFLIYIQQKAIGYIPVQERVTIANAVGQPINIGTNDTVDGFELKDSYFGSNHQFALCEDDLSLWTYDAMTQNILRISLGGQTQKVNVIAGVSKLLKEYGFNVSPNDTPGSGYGVLGAYDDKHEEVVFTFLEYKKIGVETPASLTIAFHAATGKYAGKRSFTPGLYITHNNDLFSVSMDYDVTEVADGVTYPRKSIVRSSVDPANIYVASQDITTSTPADDPSIDSRWTIVRRVETVFAHNSGDVCFIYGIVQDSSVSFVAVSEDGKEATFEYYSADLNDAGIMFDSIAIENRRQTGSELIEGSPEHELIDSHMEGNFPFDNNTGEQITGPYAIITFGKDHEGADLVNSNNEKAELLAVTTNTLKAD